MTRSPKAKKTSDGVVQASPSKKDLLYGPISRRDMLERELERCKSLISSRGLQRAEVKSYSDCPHHSYSTFRACETQCIHPPTFTSP